MLLAGVRLRLFDLLAERPLTLEELSPRLGLPREGTARLLGAAVALRLVSRRGGGRFGLGPLGAALVDNPAITEMVLHHAMLYADLADPVALLRGERNEGALARYWPYAGTDRPADLTAEQVGAYTRLMAASQPLVSGEILDAYRCSKASPPARHRRRRREFSVRGRGAGAGARAGAVRPAGGGGAGRGADSRRPGSPAGRAPSAAISAAIRCRRGADVATLVRVIHDHDDVTARGILAAARAALPPGGTLLLAEPMAATPGAEAMGDAYFGLYLLAMGSGRARTPADLTRFLREAGFARVRQAPTHTPLLTGLLVASVD